MREVAIERLDIESAEGGIDVVRCQRCAMCMAREADGFLKSMDPQRTNTRTFDSTRLETKSENILARLDVSGIPRRLPAFPRFRPEGC